MAYLQGRPDLRHVRDDQILERRNLSMPCLATLYDLKDDDDLV